MLTPTPSLAERLTVRAGSDRILLLVCFWTFALAAPLLLMGTSMGVFNIFMLPITLAVLLSAVLFGFPAVFGVGARAGLVFAVLGLAFVDLSTKPVTAIGFLLKGIAYGLCFAVGARDLVRERRQIDPASLALLVYALYAWASLAYSVDRWTSTYTGFGLFALALIGVSVAQQGFDAIQRVLNGLLIVFGLLLLATLIVYAVAPQYVIAVDVAGAGRIGGFFGSPNSLGGVAGAALLLCAQPWMARAALGPGAKWLRLLIAALALLILMLSGSRTALAATLAGLGVAAAWRWRTAALVAGLVGAIMVLALTVAASWGRTSDSVIVLASRTGTGSDVRNFTGRTEIWRFAYGEWLKEPWIGHGLGGTRTVISEGWANFWGKTTGTSHSALLETLLDLGVIGLVLLVLVFSITAWRLLRKPKLEPLPETQVGIAWSFLVFVLLIGVAEKSFAGTPSTPTSLLVLAFAIATACHRAKPLGTSRRR